MPRLSHSPSFRLPWGFVALAVPAFAVALWAAHWQGERARARSALRASWIAAAAAPALDISHLLVPAASDTAKRQGQAEGRDDKASPWDYRRVVASGHWVQESAIYLNNRTQGAEIGVFVVMAFQTAGGALVAVNRGWMAHPPGAAIAPGAYQTPGGRVTMTGIALPHEPHYLALGGAGEERLGGLWQNFDPAAFEQGIKAPIAPFVVRADGGEADGLIRRWPDFTADLNEAIERNHGYVFQWYGIAAVIAGFTLYFGFRHGRKNES